MTALLCITKKHERFGLANTSSHMKQSLCHVCMEVMKYFLHQRKTNMKQAFPIWLGIITITGYPFLWNQANWFKTKWLLSWSRQCRVSRAVVSAHSAWRLGWCIGLFQRSLLNMLEEPYGAATFICIVTKYTFFPWKIICRRENRTRDNWPINSVFCFANSAWVANSGILCFYNGRRYSTPFKWAYIDSITKNLNATQTF